MKKFTFKGVLDGFRSSVAQPTRVDQEIVESLRPDNFLVAKTFRHGFPFQPTAVAFDPIQHLLAVGTKSGSLRLLGRPGVDAHVKHEGEGAVLQIQFLLNEGALITATSDDSLHLWNFRQKKPEVVHTLKFTRERITYIHLPLQSKWLYVGTERGNIHVVNIESFVLSGYVINWNKAIEVSRKTHPGPVIHLSDNPLDASKLLIGYETGQIVLWDLRTKQAELRCQGSEPLKSITWHHEGKQFMVSHTDGSLTTWGIRQAPKPITVSHPHAKTNKDGKLEACKPIQKVEWKSSKTGEAYVIFSGGLTYDKAGRTPSITVIHGKTTTVLEMEHNVVDFITLCESPWTSDMQDPYAIVVLLHNDLVVIDLLTPGYPCFENPYPMDLHESPVTCCTYLADCPSDLIPAFYSVGSRAVKRSGFSEREWPLCGGEWSPTSCSYNEIILTGHADGSIKFWDASAGTLQVLYKLKTAKVFEKPKSRSVDGADEDPFAIQLISLCPESRKLCVAGASSHVILFKFRKLESVAETAMLEIAINNEVPEEGDCSPDYEYPPRPSLSMASKTDSGEGESKKSSLEYGTPLRVRTGPQKKPPGFQAHLVCLMPLTASGELPSQITALSINSSYGLMTYGTDFGVVIVDIVQKVCILNMTSPDLYGSADPYQRVPRSPKRDNNSRDLDERCRSPSTDQMLSTREVPKVLEPPVVPVDATIPLSSPLCKVMDIRGVDSDGDKQTLQPMKESLTVGSDISNVSSQTGTPDVEEVEEAIVALSEYSSTDAETNLKTENVETVSDLPAKSPSGDQSRRKSSTWKGLKKHLSRVDQKWKTTFASSQLPPTVVSNSAATNRTKDKRSSVFYSSAAEMPITPVTPIEIESPQSESLPEFSEDLNTPGETEVQQKSNFVLCGVLKSNQEVDQEQSVDPDKATNQQDVENFNKTAMESSYREQQFSSEQISCSQDELSQIIEEPNEDSASAKASRPMNLPLFDEDGKPVRPPRNETKKKSMEKPIEKRDIRLLSVPNIKYSKHDHTQLRDLRGKEGAPSNPSSLGILRRFNKLDSSFSRSRSSSMSSLENITAEAIQCLAFADSYTKKSDPSAFPTLWIGTSLGSVLTIMISVPPPGESRITQPVIVSPIGTIFRLKGCILTMSFLDCNGALIPYSYEAWKDENKEGRDRISKDAVAQKTPTKSTSNNRMSPTLSGQQDQFGDRQFVVLTSEKQARVVALPSHNCVYRQQLVDTEFVVKAEIISLRDSVCLVCYISNGHITAYSLPSLRPLIDIDFLPLADLRIARTFCFSNRGHGLYLCSPTEVQKFTLSAEFCGSLGEMVAELFLPHDMPEPPKESFFKGLFGGGSRSLDREELFGESSGRASRSVAKLIPGPSANIDAMGQRVTSVTSEVAKAHMLVLERGEKLNKLADSSERMMNEADTFQSSARDLMLKYKDKKWYQL